MCPPRAIADEETRAMRAHVRRLRRDDPVRSVAQAMLDDSPPGPARIGPLLFALADTSDWRWRRRAVAAWALGCVPLDEAQRQAAAQALGEVVLDNRRSTSARLLSRWGTALSRTIIVGAVAWLLTRIPVLIERAGYPTDADWIVPGEFLLIALFLAVLGLGLLATFLPVISYMSDVDRTNQARTAAAQALGRLGVPESVTALAHVARGYGCLPYWTCVRPLRRLLPLLTPDHYGQLAGSTVPDLCRMLHPDVSDSITTCLILGALGKMGDGRAVAPVERLARSGGLPEAKAATEAAKAVLPTLRARQAAERNPRLLLRAAAQPGDAAGVLLRPAGSSRGDDAANLLRAAGAEEHEP